MDGLDYKSGMWKAIQRMIKTDSETPSLDLSSEARQSYYSILLEMTAILSEHGCENDARLVSEITAGLMNDLAFRQVVVGAAIWGGVEFDGVAQCSLLTGAPFDSLEADRAHGRLRELLCALEDRIKEDGIPNPRGAELYLWKCQMKPLTPKFAEGERVRVRLGKGNRTPHEGTIQALVWHTERQRHYYLIEDKGKPVKKRYFDDDLERVSEE